MGFNSGFKGLRNLLQIAIDMSHDGVGPIRRNAIPNSHVL